MITKTLTKIADELDLIKVMGEVESPLPEKDVPSCFIVRRETTKRELEEKIKALETQSHLAPRASVLMEMLSIQVGLKTEL